MTARLSRTHRLKVFMFSLLFAICVSVLEVQPLYTLRTGRVEQLPSWDSESENLPFMGDTGSCWLWLLSQQKSFPSQDMIIMMTCHTSWMWHVTGHNFGYLINTRHYNNPISSPDFCAPTTDSVKNVFSTRCDQCHSKKYFNSCINNVNKMDSIATNIFSIKHLI